MEIEIYSDVVCPWCYLGTVRLEAALASYDGDVTLRWRPFQLEPEAPREPRPLLGWLGQRFGGTDRARQVVARVTSLAEAEGLHLDFERALIANSFDAYRLLWFADQPEAVVFGAGADTQARLAADLHRAHFTDGLDIGSPSVLVSLAERVELDGARIARLLESAEGTADVRAQLAQAHDVGITAVPTFVFGGADPFGAGRYSVAGAQESAVLRSVLDEVVRREGFAPAGPAVPRPRTAPAPDDDTRVAP